MSLTSDRIIVGTRATITYYALRSMKTSNIAHRVFHENSGPKKSNIIAVPEFAVAGVETVLWILGSDAEYKGNPVYLPLLKYL